MPARNMAGPSTVPANPSGGKSVLMDPFSGPSGSPLDNDNTGDASTGALKTGIGFGSQSPIIGAPASANIPAAGFTDDYTPGITLPDGEEVEDARLVAIGGGRSGPAQNGAAPTNPYNAQPLLGFGAGVERDAGEGPVHTGHAIKMVTASGTVADGAAIETGFVNRTGRTMSEGQSAFGSANAASPEIEVEEAPVSVEPPSVDTGAAPVVGQAFTVADGTWLYADSFSYQWYADDEQVGTDSDSYTPVEGDVGKVLSCDVTATNDYGSTTVSSNESLDVEAA